MPLFIGGPRDGQVYELDKNMEVVLVPTLSCLQFDTPLEVRQETYRLKYINYQRGTYPVYVHDSIDNPVMFLLERYQE